MVKQKPGGGPTKGGKKPGDRTYYPGPPGGTPGPIKKPRKTAQSLASEAKISRGDIKWHDWIEQRRLLVKAMRSKSNTPSEKKLIASTAKKMGDTGSAWKKKATKASVKGAGKPKGPNKPRKVPPKSNPGGRPNPNTRTLKKSK